MRVAVRLWPLIAIGAIASRPAGQVRSPGGRSSAALVYDGTRKEMLLYGGTRTDSSAHGDAFPSDLWAWNGRSWRQLIPSNGVEPPGRALPHLAYDAARQRVVMFGGRRETTRGSVELPRDIWEWDGTRWHEITSDTLRILHAVVAYDPAHRRVVLFGGIGKAGISRTVMEWDGRTWHGRDNGGPPAGTADAFPVVSSVTPEGELVVVTMQSGRSSDSVASLTWTWSGISWTRHELGPAITSLQPAAGAPDGSMYVYQTSAFWLSAPVMHTRSSSGVWTHLSPQVRPEIHGIPAAAYDPDRKRFVIYSDALWEWNGARWEKRP